MLETNIRMIKAGTKLELTTRVLSYEGNQVGPKLGEIAVSFLRRDRDLAAVVAGNCLLALTSDPVRPVERNKNGDCVAIKDSGTTRVLKFSIPTDRRLMADLVERQFELQIERFKGWWSLDSRRIWYELNPFAFESGVEAWRRYELASVVIDSEGIGLVVDISTAFISQDTVADYFVKDRNGNTRRREFERLTSRQQEQKGTLIYDNGKGRYKCYFEEWASGITCSTTGTINARGRRYDSLYDYAIAECNRNLQTDAPVARVSFTGLGAEKVPAEWLRIRVMNDSVPTRLKQVDKISPADRSRMIEEFWNKLGARPLGDSLPGLADGFWQPSRERILRLHIPALLFGNGHVLSPPETNSVNHIRAHFRNRERCLAKYGCWYVPQTLLRTVHLAIRSSCGDVPTAWLALGIQKRLSMWTKKQVNVEVICEESLDILRNKLRRINDAGLAVIVFPDDDPATYHSLEYELDEWRIKRITERQLARKARELPTNEPSNNDSETNSPRWETFVDKCALNVLELLECVPYIPISTPKYEARFGIDVGHTRRHFAVSLVVLRRVGDKWQFWADTRVRGKVDYKKEEINKTHLRDEIIELAKSAAEAGIIGIDSVVAVRDGKTCGEEGAAFEEARHDLESCGFLKPSGTIDDIDFYKNSVKGIRMWDREGDGEVAQATEGSAIRLSNRAVIAQFTGAATLTQGTAEPVIVVSESGRALEAVEDEFDLAQCNWASPSVAQRLPMELKRTDDELSHRMAQEVKRIR